MNLWVLRTLEITDERRDAAAKATTACLKAMDIKRVDEIRRGFELPPECLGFVAEIYATLLSPSPEPELSNRKNRDLVPLSSIKPVLPNEKAHLKNETKGPFLPGCFVLSNAGTIGGAADWIIHDIRIDGSTIFKVPGDVSGELFATNATNRVGTWRECRETIEVDATYIGNREGGCPLFCAVVGTEL